MGSIEIGFLGAVALTLGCATTTMTEQAAKVQLTQNPNDVVGCKHLGDTDIVVIQWYANSDDEMRARAAKLGGDWVYYTYTGNGGGVRGDVYACPATPRDVTK